MRWEEMPIKCGVVWFDGNIDVHRLSCLKKHRKQFRLIYKLFPAFKFYAWGMFQDSNSKTSSCRRPTIIWTDAGILLIRTLGINFNEILSKIHTFLLKKMHFNMSATYAAVVFINYLHSCSLENPWWCQGLSTVRHQVREWKLAGSQRPERTNHDI